MKFILKISFCFMLFTITNTSIMAQENTSKVTISALKLSKDFTNVRDFAMSSNGKEGYITVQSPLGEVSVLVKIKKTKKEWKVENTLPFSGQYSDLEPFLSKNDLRLYFASNRPVSDTIKVPKDFDIWYVERPHINAKWGNPINLGAPINTEHDEFYPSVADNNNLYFTSNAPNSNGKDDIFYSAWKNSKYTKPVALSTAVNTAGYEFNSYVAQDESFLIFSGYKRKDGFGSADLYISYRKKDQSWSQAINLGSEINSKQMDYCPFVDTKSMELYFTSKRSDFKKVNNFQSIEDFLSAINKSENGLSKIYKVPFKKQSSLLKKY